MDEKKVRQKELTELLTKAGKAYYQENREIMSNFEYDRLYDELRGIETRIESFFNRVSHLLKDRTSRKYDRYHISGSFIVK